MKNLEVSPRALKLVQSPSLDFAADRPAPESEVPLVVDVDGTLVRTDLLVESWLLLMTSRPVDALRVLQWLFQGRAQLKIEIADRAPLDIELLPLDEKVVAFMQAERASGRRVYLASASDRRFVEALGQRLGCVDGVFATEQGNNLSGEEKRKLLVREFGEKGFDYIGDSAADRPVWAAARRGHVVHAGFRNPARRLSATQTPPKLLCRRPIGLAMVARALRLHQWSKNLLVFVPLVLGGGLGDADAIWRTLAAFLAFGLLASATYLLNDIVDVNSDRKHRVKRNRPIASGALPITLAIGMAAVTGASGLAIATMLGLPVFLGLMGYLVLTLAYSWWLKRLPVVDTALLAGLYAWRLFVGVLAANVLLSAWLLVFSFAFFLSLSIAKRHAEVTEMITSGMTTLPGRGYRTSDAPFLMSMGIGAGMSSLLVFVLYLVEGAFHAAHFKSPLLLWICAVVLLLWLCRIWLLCGRGELHHDPVEFAIRDRKSLILGGAAGVAVVAALFA